MAWYDKDSLATMAFSPNRSTMIITVLVVLIVPILLHIFLYRPAVSTGTPRFVLLGPSGSGKTALVAQFERGEVSQTHTSINPITVETSLPLNITPASAQYRSENDKGPAKKLLLADTPGHSKLRHMAIETLAQSKTKPLTGVLFVLDAAAISSDGGSSDGLTETAIYLHDVLLHLQKQSIQSQGKAKPVPFLIAANKMDLFTALPEKVVRGVLQTEITKLRDTKSRGISSIAQSTNAEGLNFGTVDDADDEDESNVLGGNASGDFKFDLLEEYSIDVSVLGGSVVEGEKGVEKWWEWIADLL